MQNDSSRTSRWPWLLAAGCALVVLIALFRSSLCEGPTPSVDAANQPHSKSDSQPAPVTASARRSAHGLNSDPSLTASEIVSNKVAQFGRSRHEIVRGIARR